MESKEPAAAPKAEGAPEGEGAKSPAAKAAAARAKAAAGGKTESAKEPFKDNGDGTVTDPASGLMWRKKDAWLEKRHFYKWKDHKSFLDELNSKKFAGYSDWRLPTKDEAATLVDKGKQLIDKNGIIIPIDPVFEEGCFASTWIQECKDDQILRYDLKIGLETPYPGNDIWSSIWACRGASGAPASDKPKVAAKPAGVKPAPAAKPAEAPPA